LAFEKLKDIVNTLDVGKFSAVFKGPDGFYIVKIDEKTGGKEKTLEEVKEGIKADLSYLKYLQGLQQLQNAIPVQTNLKLLEAK
jgi:parvulin-like peptidyl-prolyl isomerase